MAAPHPASDRPELRTPQLNLYVQDLGRSLQFYRDLLGFTETFRAPPDGPPIHIELRLGHFSLGLVPLEALARHPGLTGGGEMPRGELVVWSEDVDVAYAWLVAQGARSLVPPHDFATVLRGAWVADPDGNPVQVVTRRPTH